MIVVNPRLLTSVRSHVFTEWGWVLWRSMPGLRDSMPSASSREQRRANINYRNTIVATPEPNDPTRPLEFNRGRSSWEARVRHEALRLRADLASLQADSTRTMSSVDRQRIAKIGEYLDHADAALDHYFRRNWPVRLVIASRAYQEA